MGETPPQGNPPVPPRDAAGAAPQPQQRGWFGRIALAPLWLASVLLLGTAVAVAVAYLLMRQPPIVETTAPMPPAAAASPEMLRRAEALRTLNRALEEQLETLRNAVARPQCPPGTASDASAGGMATADGAGLMPQPPTPAQAPAAAAGTTAMLPTAPLAAAEAGGTAPALANADLATALDRATALVLTRDSTATGFFVTEQLLVTNRHAVDGADEGRVLLASGSLGQVRPGRVVGTSPPGPPGSPDFALVRLLQGTAPGTLPMTTSFAKLMKVVAAGYPFFSIENDQGFRRLVGGDAAAAPDLNVTTGTVQAVQKTSQGATAIVHEAAILRGNSGGPLVDACGRVIGVNTFIAVDKEQSARNNYALATADLAAFLQRTKTAVPTDSRACAG